MSLLNARAYKMSGSQITLSQILTIIRDVQTHPSHVTTLTARVENAWKAPLEPKIEDESRSGDQQRDYLRLNNEVSGDLGGTAAIAPSRPRACRSPPNRKHDHRKTLQAAANGS